MTDPTPDLRAAADRAYGPADDVTHRAHERAAGMASPAVSEPELEDELLAFARERSALDGPEPTGPPSLDEVPWIVMPASGGPLIIAGALLHPGLAVYPAPGPEGATPDVSPESGHFTVDSRSADDRKPTLGGRVPGTGYWTVDDLPRPDHPLSPEGITSRPALRDPQGGSWVSWSNLPQLDGLRAQLAAGAKVLSVDQAPYQGIDAALAGHLHRLALELAMNGNPGPVVAASIQVEGKRFDITIATAPKPHSAGHDLPPVDPTVVGGATVDVETDEGERLGEITVPIRISQLLIGGERVDFDTAGLRRWLGIDDDPSPERPAGRCGRPHAIAHLFLAFGPGRPGRRFGEWLHARTTEWVEA